MRGPLLALAAGLIFIVGTAALVLDFSRDLDLGHDLRYLGPLAFILIGAGILIGFFLWMRSKR
ncbi:hypothetical protein [Aquibaculum arenosum]|uniref:DUF3955 domain-containing protein n=1 Tax=Aquibaculum arenosum TaxID=3032591 RepID=A0ABT5YR71_9PROT|nr:hypothetical protein [Fodinicurvata sp. CAU 1616]MDF2096714.1 hypothetical protein [Fodinicurvata sp. CAU 1616]